MSFRAYLIMMIAATIISWVAWVTVIFSINPFETDFLGLTFFYSTLFLSLMGTISILGNIVRKKFIKDDILFRQVIVSFRQSVLFAILIVVSLILQSNEILSWWSILFLIGALAVIELFAISKKKII